MHGIGNDFVMVDGVRSALPEGDPAELARAVCDRRFGVGADGLIYIEKEPHPQPLPSNGAQASPFVERGVFRMRMWNPDGSESEMCGNGIRCVARFLLDEGIVAPAAQGQESRVKGQESGDQGQGSRVKGQASSVNGQGPGDRGQASRVKGQGPGDQGQGSRVKGQASSVNGQGPGDQGQASSDLRGSDSGCPDSDAAKRQGIPVMTGAGMLYLEEAEGGQIRVDMGVARLTRGEIGMVGVADETFVGQGIEARGQASSDLRGSDSGCPDSDAAKCQEGSEDLPPLAPPSSPARTAGQEGGGFRGTAVSMGNPHLVILTNDVAAIDLHRLGPVLEHHELFPNRTNVHFVEVLDRGHIVQRTWERGAGATLACGTGACASAVAAFLNGLTDRTVLVDLPGGRLRVEYAEDGHVFMTGPAETVFDGEWSQATTHPSA